MVLSRFTFAGSLKVCIHFSKYEPFLGLTLDASPLSVAGTSNSVELKKTQSGNGLAVQYF